MADKIDTLLPTLQSQFGKFFENLLKEPTIRRIYDGTLKVCMQNGISPEEFTRQMKQAADELKNSHGAAHGMILERFTGMLQGNRDVAELWLQCAALNSMAMDHLTMIAEEYRDDTTAGTKAAVEQNAARLSDFMAYMADLRDSHSTGILVEKFSTAIHAAAAKHLGRSVN